MGKRRGVSQKHAVACLVQVLHDVKDTRCRLDGQL